MVKVVITQGNSFSAESQAIELANLPWDFPIQEVNFQQFPESNAVNMIQPETPIWHQNANRFLSVFRLDTLTLTLLIIK